MDKPLKYLNELTWQYRASRILQTAIRIGLFSRLSQRSCDVEQLASLCSAKKDILDKVLIVCCAMGFLDRKGNLFSNTELTETYLVEGRPLYQGNIIAHSTNVWEFWDNLPDEIQISPSLQDNAQAHRNFILGMENITLAGRGQIFIENIDLSNCRKMLDVGGGPATYSILACQKYPQLKSTVFDLPETIAIAKERIHHWNLADRIDVQEGSWEVDSFGTGYDVILFSNVLHGPNSQTEMKLKKGYQALNPGGLLLIQEFLLNDSKTGPLIPALFNVMVGAYSRRQLLDITTACGFINPHIVVDNEEIGCSWIQAQKK